jgi:hypothetical protein
MWYQNEDDDGDGEVTHPQQPGWTLVAGVFGPQKPELGRATTTTNAQHQRGMLNMITIINAFISMLAGYFVIFHDFLLLLFLLFSFSIIYPRFFIILDSLVVVVLVMYM